MPTLFFSRLWAILSLINDPTAKVRPDQGVFWRCVRSWACSLIPSGADLQMPIAKSPLRAELVDGADFLCIRELTGGMYFGEEISRQR